MREGMNIFLRDLGVTFRRDPQTRRPRANKPGSTLDREQRGRGEYFYL
jgi:ATP-binding cassette subfamily E protein 1